MMFENTIIVYPMPSVTRHQTFPPPICYHSRGGVHRLHIQLLYTYRHGPTYRFEFNLSQSNYVATAYLD
jgi:hypothetical protein